MSKQANPTVIGGFVIGAVVLVIGGILIFGSGKFFADIVRSVMYFEGDLKGLRVGASVNFQGVPIGTVSDIKAVVDPKEIRAHIPVVVEISRDKMQWMGERPAQGAMLRQLIARGLRGQLQLESMVTGQLFIQLDFHPEAPAVEPRIDPLTKLPEIPTIPTAMQQVQQTVRKALEKIGDMPLEEIVNNIHTTLQGIDRVVNAPEVLEAVRNLNTTLTDVQQLVHNIDKQVTPVTASATKALGSVTDAMGNVGKLAKNVDDQVPAVVASLRDTLGTAQGALQRTQETLTSVNDMMTPTSSVRYELAKTLQEVAGAASALRMLTNYLERYPNAVVFGRNEASAK
jgi:paraquat-inducible protein B